MEISIPSRTGRWKAFFPGRFAGSARVFDPAAATRGTLVVIGVSVDNAVNRGTLR
jgi:hypothetical protein